MQNSAPNTTPTLQKTVRVIPATVTPQEEKNSSYRQIRVAAYCRVSTKEEEQINSYELQQRYYTEKIQQEPKWTLAGIYADKGITGTSVKKRDEFNRMIRDCKRGKIDMIITKSISRFSRNTVDCLSYVRMLKEIGVEVYFEEQGLHSTQPGAEFYITLYGSIAQSESENISANVRFGKAQSAKEGKVTFHYSRFLGYRKGADGKPEIDPEQAEVVRRIYTSFLSGDSLETIASNLNADHISTPSGKGSWNSSTIRSILTNEKYKGDAILNKTYVTDCISRKVRVNNGERPKYYVENNHPAIIDAATFSRVQEEIARRSSKQKVKRVGTKTEQGKYSSKYALTELLICGECHTPYRRCTWNVRGKKKVVWRCINRLDYGTKYCHNSPSLEETALHEAIMSAIMECAQQSNALLDTLKHHIAIGLSVIDHDDPTPALEMRIIEIDREYNRLLTELASNISSNTFDDTRIREIMEEKRQIQQQIEQYSVITQKRMIAASRVGEISSIIDALKNRSMRYDDQIVRQILECVVVESKEQIRVVFVGGIEVVILI